MRTPMFIITLLVLPLDLMVNIAFDNKHVEAVCTALIVLLGVLTLIESFTGEVI